MTSSLRHLLIQRAARLQERPALTTPEWGTLSYFQFRNRVEGVALGILATAPLTEKVVARTGTAWDWACEVAAACCGVPWNAFGSPVAEEILGGKYFNDERGRQAYHDREESLGESSWFTSDLTHGELQARLQRLNRHLGWDHETRFVLPLAALATPEGRGAIWSALYAGAHAELVNTNSPATWDAASFRGLLSK